MIEKGDYRHYKGGIYQVVDIGKHTETEEDLVIYRDTKGKIWLRPVSMWKEEVNGRPRFMYYTDKRSGYLDFILSQNDFRRKTRN